MGTVKIGMKHMIDKHIVIGITGGAGGGKSTIVEYICANYDTEFIHCDVIAHELMKPGHENYKALINEYGEGILDGNLIKREKLLKAVTDSPEGFRRLNEITHPRVTLEVLKRIENSVHKYIVIEAALLIESRLTKICDDVWFVFADKGERIQRIKKSRNWDDGKIQKIFENQMSDDDFKKYSTFVINNHDGNNAWINDINERIKFLDGKNNNC